MSSAMIWQTTRYAIALTQPRVMGIVNLTPDSFSDGGHTATPGVAIERCEKLLAEGADILDLGAESTRPGASPVDWREEWRRLESVLIAALRLGCPVSVDTMKTEVMQRSLDLGADIINDVHALRAPGAVELVAGSGCGICLMHMHGEPRSMQQAPLAAGDAVGDVRQFLAARAEVVRQAGVAAARIVLDPGIGFGKSVATNFDLVQRQDELLELGYPLLVGWSRKSSLGTLTGRPPGERLPASLAAALAAVQRGAHVVRVHDVAATVDALAVWAACGLPQLRPAASPTIAG